MGRRRKSTSRLRTEGAAPGELNPSSLLEDFGRSLPADQPLDAGKEPQGQGSAFVDPGLANIRDVGEKACSVIHGPLRDDISAFIKGSYGASEAAMAAPTRSFRKWRDSDRRRAEEDVDKPGEATPETVRSMLFSQKPSDVRRLAENLPETARRAARTAIVQRPSPNRGIENISVERFVNAWSG